jgi:hypothetical protein
MSEEKQSFEIEIHPTQTSTTSAVYGGKNQELEEEQSSTVSDELDYDDAVSDGASSADDEDDDVGEEIYSVYDDDEAWPRRLKDKEVEMANSFFDAVECGEVDIVEELLEEFPQLVNVTRQKQGGDFALYIAAGMGDLAMAEALMKPNRSTPVQVHARTVHGHSALSAAALFGHPSVVESLIACGLDVNSKNVEGLRLVDEVLDDIDYSLVGDDSGDELELSQSVTRSGGGSDPLLLEKAGILLLRAGAHMSNSNVYAFHDKFCGAWGDVTDDELQDAIEIACQAAAKAELEQERTNEERARTPALVIRRLGAGGRNGDGNGGGSQGMGDLDVESRPSLFKKGLIMKARKSMEADPDARTSPRGPKSGRSRAGRIRQRRYIRSPKVAESLGVGSGGVSPTKPPSPDRSSASNSVSPSGISVRPRGTPPRQNATRVIQDLSDIINEEVAFGVQETHSDDSLEVSWSKQVDGPPTLPPRPKSHGDQGNGDMLEESHPPRVKLPSIADKK